MPNSTWAKIKKIGQKGDKVFNKITGNKISAIVPVHVFGLPSKINEIKQICAQWNLPIEDAAEALGSSIINESKRTHCGCFGDIGIISFNGNKIITTGGGGALLTNDSEIAKLAKHLSTTAKLSHPWEFFHDQIGWNDRLPNINAALGVSQIEVLQTKLNNKRILHEKYKMVQRLWWIRDTGRSKNCQSNYWLITMRILEQSEILKNKILEEAHSLKIFLRPSWILLNRLHV